MKQVGLYLFLVALVVMCMSTIAFAAGETKPVAPGVAKPTLAVKPVTAKPVKAVDKQKKDAASAKKVALIDINTASAKQLKSLSILTESDVKKIIAGRPYANKEELKWKQIITAPTYDVIKMNIIAKQATKPAKSTKSDTSTKSDKSTTTKSTK
jgi:DNA uptake protein ComE-like DNA-binding protein